MKKAKLKCWLCGKIIVTGWTNRLVSKENEGSYCSKNCAQADAWGPRFEKSYPLRIAISKLSSL
jgi:hypothetical protein